jgi:predicted 3-demethylubiquinone-9 3-methyltransferase (glyoxalase superfamily)
MCDTQADVDYFWDKLSAGGDPNSQQCAWLKDKFGVSWQVVPTELIKLIADPDTARAGRAMQAMMGMNKIDIAVLRKAAGG